MNYLVGFVIGIMLTFTLGLFYATKNEDLRMRQLKYIVKHGYFTGCVDGLVAGSPYDKDSILEACDNATDRYSAPIDKLLENAEL